MNVFQFIFNIFFGSFIWIIDFINEWHSQAAAVGFHPSKFLMFILFLLAVIIVGSSMFAMTVAEVKNRNRLINGILGGILPVVYPVLMYFVMPKYKMSAKNEKEEKKKKIKTMLEPMPTQEIVPKSNMRSIQKADKKGIDPSVSAVENTDEYNEYYFSHIMKDESGNFAGPFIFELEDGKILEVLRITATMPTVASVVIGTEETEQRTIRLPYNKIKACHLKSEWLEGEEFDEDY
jgi:hypothetical protein